MMFEYMDRMVMFKDTPEGLTADMEWLKEAGENGWELVYLRSAHRPEPGRDRLRHGGVPDDPQAPQADAVSEKIKIRFISKKGLDTKRRDAIYNKTHL